MPQSITEFVRTNVDPKAYYSSIFPEIKWLEGTQPRVLCCFHDDKKTPSLHFNPETGAFYCHGCETGGKSIIAFHSKLNEVSGREAAIAIYDKFVHRVIPDSKVREWHRALRETPTVIRYLTGKKRMLSWDVIQRRKLCWNGQRIGIPIQNEFGLYINIKWYDPLNSKKGGAYKMLNYKEHEGDPYQWARPTMLYGLDSLKDRSEPIFVCEGEFDKLALESIGLQSITSTNGSKSWPKQFNELFRGWDVVICYDNDKDGTKYDRKPMRNLAKVAKRIRRLHIPKQVGKDVTDWIGHTKRMQRAVGWKRITRKQAKVMVENPDEYISKPAEDTVPLDEASDAKWYNKPITVSAMITGKDTAPYMLPRKFRATCSKECDNCPLATAGEEFKQCEFDPQDPAILTMVDAKKNSIESSMLAKAGVGGSTKCHAQVEITEAFNLEQLILIPTIGSYTSSNKYVTRAAYYVGHGLHSNKAYKFSGITVPHPQDQHSTHLFTSAKPVQDEVSTFKLTDELKEQLKIFQPKNLSIMAHLMAMAEWQSRNITKIKNRHDIHIGMDLVFHSVSSFTFNGEYVARGMLDALIVGDTRCGKGYVAEGLVRYYKLGEVASGEACTFAGLVGGIQQIGRKFVVTWGLIPMNSDRLVVIDEMSSLSEHDIGQMSRVRSEGIAEITKIVRESTRANSRLIWIANPRSGRPMGRHNSGVQVIKELVGANEDISRFDFAMAVATSEVESEVINSIEQNEEFDDSTKYGDELCRALVLWAWSRRPEQIKFTRKAINEIIKQAITFGNAYSPEVPLVQAENIRIKIAKVAAAVAARVYSTNEGAELLVVDKDHVKCACQFLRMCYDKESMGYDTFSRVAIARSTISDSERVERIFKDLGSNRYGVVQGLSELHRINVDNLCDYVGDPVTAKTLIGDLVQTHCLARVDTGGNWYIKNPSFISWLREQRRPLNGKHNGTANQNGR